MSCNCGTCGGTKKTQTECNRCYGMGRLRTGRNGADWQTCSGCSGVGVLNHVCGACGGTGRAR